MPVDRISQSASMYRSQVKSRSTVSRACAPSSPGSRQRVEQRALERLRVARLDEPAVDSVLELVPVGDRVGAGDDDGLRHRHRLQEHGRGAAVAVRLHRKGDDACAAEAVAHLLEREVALDRDVRRQGPEGGDLLLRRDDAKCQLVAAECDCPQQLEVTAGIGADRDDVDIRRLRRGAKGLDVDAERNEDDFAAEPIQFRSQLGFCA